MRSGVWLSVLGVVCCAVATAAAAPVVVGVKAAEPFAVRADDGAWRGLAVDLWESIADEVGVRFEYREFDDVPAMLAGVASGELEAGVGAVTVTRAREESVDFSHTFYTGGLAIAVSPEVGTSGPVRAILGLVTPAFLTGVGGLVVLLFGVGFVVWVVERRENTEMFGGGLVRGLGNSFWFSAVTMTTVGYGDKAPITPAGRVVTLVWMFASIIVISFFTGAIASAFTATALSYSVSGPEDLARARVGVVEGTAAVGALAGRGVSPRVFDDVDAGLAAVASGDLDAFVHDDAILRVRAAREFSGRVRVLDATFAPYGYAFVLRPGDDRREEINRALLEAVSRPAWGVYVRRVLSGIDAAP